MARGGGGGEGREPARGGVAATNRQPSRLWAASTAVSKPKVLSICGRGAEEEERRTVGKGKGEGAGSGSGADGLPRTWRMSLSMVLGTPTTAHS